MRGQLTQNDMKLSKMLQRRMLKNLMYFQKFIYMCRMSCTVWFPYQRPKIINFEFRILTVNQTLAMEKLIYITDPAVWLWWWDLRTEIGFTKKLLGPPISNMPGFLKKTVSICRTNSVLVLAITRIKNRAVASLGWNEFLSHHHQCDLHIRAKSQRLWRRMKEKGGI